MNRKHLIRLCFILLIISIGCDDQGEQNTLPQDGYYAFGRHSGSAVYWKDGKGIDVDGYTLNFGGAAVSGRDVYAIGYVNDHETYRGAAYWKNGKMFKLSNGTQIQVPTAIAFAGSDMYIAGYEEVGDKSIPIYWKNGERHLLPGKEVFLRPTAIAVSGADVHIVGMAINKIQNADSILIAYWKNNERIKVTPTASREMIDDIAVSGDDVYFAGHTFETEYRPRAKVWKNSVATVLTDGSNLSYATEVEVNGNDVYLAGKVGIRAVYWKNAVMAPLETGAEEGSDVTGLAVVRDQLIISGKNYDAGYAYSGSFVWRDGQLLEPFTGNGVDSIIDCIAPVQ